MIVLRIANRPRAYGIGTVPDLGQLPGRLMPSGGILFQALETNDLELNGDVTVELRRRDRRLADDLKDGLDRRFAAERRPAGQQLIRIAPRPYTSAAGPTRLD